ncbi:N-substituted formamide deformylase precursor [Nocardioides dokdonensis FR1436]|uniref:N-substituted formamide deformylase n=1 Tax=Nocardioides dokdonensis FR1436 TaxID=1300347 RepID=A0A1A9GNP2_9ACTN|nr:amidohydrolase [Nocardioides dokdonensis]ANH39706.1 N-substituted formamide deformylase precursor [Nocardioides dokdonensis FR1436]
MRADLLLTNARVRTLEGPGRADVARSVAVWRDRIVAVDEDVPAHRVVDLDGAVVAPGFHDAHNHMAWFGQSLEELDLRLPTLEALYDAVARRARELPEGAWVIGAGYDENKIGAHPTRDGLDRAAGGRRVWLRHTSGHMCVASSALLDDLGLADAAVDVPGGRVVVDAAGRPTGLLQEQAQHLVNALVLPYPVTGLVDAIERAGQVYLSQGLTSVVEAGVGGGWIGRSPVEVAAYQEARAQGRLPVRVELMVAADALRRLEGHADDDLGIGLDLGIRTGLGDDRLRLGPVKIFSDGSLIGHTCALSEEFSDTPGEKGYLQDDAEVLRTRILDAHRSGWRVAAHAIGDAAIDLVLDSYEEAQRRWPRADVRHRIEHFGVSRPDQVARAAALGVVPVPQGRFVGEIGDGMLRALGPARAGWAYRYRSLLDAGIVVPGSSDRPVVDGTPLRGIHDMVNRLTDSGQPCGPEEAITGLEALTAYTLGSAHASHQEHERGSIAVGKLADLVVLDDDPATVDAGVIRDIEVLRTFLGGEVVWQA